MLLGASSLALVAAVGRPVSAAARPSDTLYAGGGRAPDVPSEHFVERRSPADAAAVRFTSEEDAHMPGLGIADHELPRVEHDGDWHPLHR